MPKVWNLGNTTVRNPNRIQEGLVLFAKEFQGNIYGEEQEAAFSKRLNEVGVLATAGSEPAWLGRKWRNVFVKLGFVTVNFIKAEQEFQKLLCKELGLKGLVYEVTPAGELLIKANSNGAITDIFTRQLICLEIPSSTEPEFKNFKMKPFIFLLQVLFKLRAKKEKGLNKTEIAIFIQQFREHTIQEVNRTVDEILEYRSKREKISGSGRVKFKEFDRDFLNRKGTEGGVKFETLGDYADTTVRYSRMTGLFAFNGSSIVLRENKIKVIEQLIQDQPKFLHEISKTEYLKVFYKGASLPTDDPKFAITEINRLAVQVKVSKEVEKLTDKTDIRKLEQERHRLQELNVYNEEEKYATLQCEQESLSEILKYLNIFASGSRSEMRSIIDPPTYLEWVTWRAFLAIDHIAVPIHKTRRFPIDEDMLPRHPAPGGGPDMIFEFKDFIFAVEVTLTTSDRQEAVEGISVRRHVSGVRESSRKAVYGVFIAPVIDNNTAEVFRVGSFYKDDKEHIVDIVPFTFLQFMNIVKVLLRTKYGPQEFKELLEGCLSVRPKIKAPEWKVYIEEETKKWVQDL